MSKRKRAKPLTAAQIKTVADHIQRTSRQQARDLALFYLSFRAGLRAAEIAALQWTHVLNADGSLADQLSVPGGIKYGTGRAIALHPDLLSAFVRLRGPGVEPRLPIICDRRGAPISANAVAQWFLRLFATCRLEGCSSHSGRRTLLTTLARTCTTHGASLRDVMQIAGHRHLSTTECYLEASEQAKRAMILALP